MHKQTDDDSFSWTKNTDWHGYQSVPLLIFLMHCVLAAQF